MDRPRGARAWRKRPARSATLVVSAGGTAGRSAGEECGWVRNPIDAFIAAEHGEARTGADRAEAAKATLLRRCLSRSDRSAAHARRAARLRRTTRPRRLREGGRPAARASASTASAGAGTGWTCGATAIGTATGNEIRDSQRHIWRWRDWIVESLNADKGYDRMIVEMLAGDELAPSDPDTLRRHRLSGPQLVQVQPQRVAREHGRAHGQGVSGRDAQLLPLPRPQVRPDRAGGLLPLPGVLRAARRAIPTAVPGQPDTTKDGAAAGLRREGRHADVLVCARQRSPARQGSSAHTGPARGAWSARQARFAVPLPPTTYNPAVCSRSSSRNRSAAAPSGIQQCGGRAGQSTRPEAAAHTQPVGGHRFWQPAAPRQRGDTGDEARQRADKPTPSDAND